MLKQWFMRVLPLAAAATLLVPAAPAAAQRDDIGRTMEREYGVVGTDSREGRRFNAMLDDVVAKIVRSVNRRQGGDFQLAGAAILGGRAEKTDKVVNAFALPDGRIYVTLGLMRLIQGSATAEDELAFVVGHEVTHVAEHHSASQAKKTLPINILAGILGAATKNRTIGTIAGVGAAAYGAKFSRKDEYEADEGGLIAMNDAGYDPDAAVTMLERLGKLSSGSGGLNKWFASHPASESRVERVQEMIQDIRAGKRLSLDGEERDRPRRRDR
jgi:predicted Zn-dependent protease